MTTALLLFLIGIGAGTVGTIVGLGGGFLVVPILRSAFAVAPATAAAASLLMVVANALSGSIVYLRDGRADVRVAMLTGVTGIPASIVGAISVGRTSSGTFDAAFAFLLAISLVAVVERLRKTTNDDRANRISAATAYRPHDVGTLFVGAVLGFVSSFFGIGGGFIFIFAYLTFFRMPPRIVSATSTLAILVTAPIGVVAHALATGIRIDIAVPLCVGGLIGGRIGPTIAKRLTDRSILGLLVICVAAAGISLAARHYGFGR